jgi:GNAT superfamily N-acetyltransferase
VPTHQRRGLGTAVMQTLRCCRRDEQARELLVATDAGRALYEKLGWRVISPYATGYIA